ncbi:unnamed protein product [Candidula unifasciata]|uniref:Uncharacterized protein n=1 Tax=Candidula unifasciata TaxID=100452 RepID=A0A8S3ZI23_9EUPU|nr:unnamed protein product [Candidula unifasciata]
MLLYPGCLHAYSHCIIYHLWFFLGLKPYTSSCCRCLTENVCLNHRPTRDCFTGHRPNGRTDQKRRTDNDSRTEISGSENVYDEINLTAAQAETGQNPYAPLRSDQNEIINGIDTKLDSLESNQHRLQTEFRDSQTRILSELSQVKEMVNSLSALVKTSLTTFQQMSTEQEQRVQQLATNLGQEVFHMGEEVMTTIRKRNEEDLAIQKCLQQLEADRISRPSSDSKKNSKRNALPSL